MHIENFHEKEKEDSNEPQNKRCKTELQNEDLGTNLNYNSKISNAEIEKVYEFKEELNLKQNLLEFSPDNDCESKEIMEYQVEELTEREKEVEKKGDA